jgi:hypothetical protein
VVTSFVIIAHSLSDLNFFRPRRPNKSQLSASLGSSTPSIQVLHLSALTDKRPLSRHFTPPANPFSSITSPHFPSPRVGGTLAIHQSLDLRLKESLAAAFRLSPFLSQILQTPSAKSFAHTNFQKTTRGWGATTGSSTKFRGPLPSVFSEHQATPTADSASALAVPLSILAAHDSLSSKESAILNTSHDPHLPRP